MNYQKKPEPFVFEFFKKDGINDSLSYYAWPETFGSTAGPRGGIGGQAITTFTIEVWASEYFGAALYLCAGMYFYQSKGFEPFVSPERWTKLPTPNQTPEN